MKLTRSDSDKIEAIEELVDKSDFGGGWFSKLFPYLSGLKSRDHEGYNVSIDSLSVCCSYLRQGDKLNVELESRGPVANFERILGPAFSVGEEREAKMACREMIISYLEKFTSYKDGEFDYAGGEIRSVKTLPRSLFPKDNLERG